ncbi:MAG: hypothetical protein ABSF58_15175 [Solirubrobacteraceae bacterium]|jgi:hypothetical protein
MISRDVSRKAMSRVNFQHHHKLQFVPSKANCRNTFVLFLCVSLFSPVLAFSQTRNLEILVPPGVVNQSEYTNNLGAMIKDATVTGATITVYWSDFDCGNANCTASGTSHNNYNWSITDAAFQPWEGTNNGKKINIVLQMISNSFDSTCASTGIGSRGVASAGGYSTGNCAMPAWVWNMLGSSNYTVCNNNGTVQMFGNYFKSSFQTAYQNAVAALIDHYANSLAQFKSDYIRVALGHGGEMLPSPQWSGDCLSQLETWSGATSQSTFISDWISNWLTPMADFMGGKNFNGAKTPMQIMGSITPMGTDSNCTGCQVPDSIAPVYVLNEMGFGSQGFEISDVGSANGTADWVYLFGQEHGKVPLELQTLGQSCPGGVGACDSGNINCTVNGHNYSNESLSSCTGALPTLLPFAESNYATILEIYYQDWDLANVGSYCTEPGGTTQYCHNESDPGTGETYGQITKSALNGWAN